MKHTSLNNQIKEQKGLRFWAGDVIIIKTSEIPMVSNTISIVYQNPFFKYIDEHLSLPNTLGVWNFLKKISEGSGKNTKVDIKVEVWDKKGNVSFIDFKDSKPYTYRFNNTK